MALNSPIFLLFLLVCTVVYYLLPQKLRNVFLLAASYTFYLLTLREHVVYAYAGLLIFTTALSFFAAKLIYASKSDTVRKAVMWTSVIIPVSLLFVFKYFNFFMSGLGSAAGAFGIGMDIPSVKWILPIGISFYTFQIIGYILDVYNKNTIPETSFVNYALFVSFFPQIMSGPIGRSREMLPQYREKHDFDYSHIVEGLQRFLLGAFKKCVIADGLARIVNGVYGDLATYKGLAIWAAVFMFGIQIYCDFSGYSDMAVGAGKILGFRLRENFNAPYMATNMSGFWKRWHMSLTTWFNDYIFTPLVWSRWANKLVFGKKWEEHAPHFMTNILIVFVISGLWHGASVTYIIWGLLNGMVRVIEELISKRNKKLKRKKKKDAAAVIWLKRAGVFALFSFTLIFFRSPSVSDAFYVIRNLFSWMPVKELIAQFAALSDKGMIDGAIYYIFFWGSIAAAILFVAMWDKQLSDSMAQKGDSLLMNPLAQYSAKKRWALYWYVGLVTTAFYMISASVSTASFIYAGY
ncbi:MAG: MBOAT family O-acyltransferase [Oscillospiraceae bacterium]